MGLFFRLLPTDLQIDILSTWLDNKDNGYSLLRVLSSLDVACSKTDRTTFRSLTSELPLFGEYVHTSNNVVMHVASFLEWLLSRKVRVKVLLLSLSMHKATTPVILHAKSTLPHVEVVYWKGYGQFPNPLVESVLRLCPGITTIDCWSLPQAFGVKTFVTQAPQLTSLTLSGHYSDWPLDSLRLVGPQLRELNMKTSVFRNLLSFLANNLCPFLQVLHIKTDTTAMIMLALKGLKHLRDFCLNVEQLMSASEVQEIVSMPQFQRLAFITSASSVKTDHVLFASMFEIRNDLDYLQIGNCHFARTDGILQLDCNGVNANVITRVLDACLPNVHSFKLTGNTAIADDVTEIVAERLAGQLHSLTLARRVCPFIETALLRSGPCLEHLHFNWKATDELLLFMSSHCPHLSSLASVSLSGPELTDAGMIAFIACLPRLQKLTLDRATQVTVKTMQAIVEHRIHLKSLELNYCDGITEADERWFVEQFRELQFLPVVTLLCKSDVKSRS